MNGEKLAFVLGGVKQATEDLTHEIKGLRGDLKPMVEKLEKHQERLINGDHSFKSINNKIKVLFVGICLILIIIVPQAYPAIKLFIRGIF